MEHRVFAGITAVILLLSSVLLYFSEDDEKDIDDIIAGNGLVPVWERVNQPFNTTGSYSYTLEKGEYGITGPESVFVDVDLPSSRPALDNDHHLPMHKRLLSEQGLS